MFVFSGVYLEKKERTHFLESIAKLNIPSDLIDECKKSFYTLPVRGEIPPKKCIFLEGRSCSIYEIRPQRCREYPVMISVKKDVVDIDVSFDCPRGEKLAQLIKTNPPPYIREIAGIRKINVRCFSFFEKQMNDYNAEG